MIIAEFMEALKLVMTQKLLKSLEFSTVEGLYYLAPANLFWMACFAAFVEVPKFIQNGGLLIVYQNVHLFLLASLLGFLVNFVGLMVIRATSSLTLKILATIRNVGLVIVSVLLFSEVVTALQAFGYGVSIIGFALYNYVKMTEVSTTKIRYEKVTERDNEEVGA